MNIHNNAELLHSSPPLPKKKRSSEWMRGGSLTEITLTLRTSVVVCIELVFITMEWRHQKGNGFLTRK